MSTTPDTALREMRLLRRNANNATKKVREDTAPAIDELNKEVEPLIDLLDSM